MQLTPPVLLLTEQQLQALRSCARGISLRFESHEVVSPLLTAGFVEKNVAGVIRITKAGHEYLSTGNALAAPFGPVSP